MAFQNTCVFLKSLLLSIVMATSRQLKRNVGLARLEAEEAGTVLARVRAAVAEVSPDLVGEIGDELTALEGIVDRLTGTLGEVGVGVTVAQAAKNLEVSQPTVRKWIHDGYLEIMADRKPREVTQRSVAHMKEVMQNVRDAFPDRRWADALAAYLHDQDILSGDWAVDGIEQLNRGGRIER